MKSLSRMTIAVGAVATIVLTALSLVVFGAIDGSVPHFRSGSDSVSSCAAPNLPGTVVQVALSNMGGPMMSGGNGVMNGGAMHLSAEPATVRAGTVSFLVTNAGSISHEMIILPLSDSQIVGTRPIGADGKIDETGSVGEASNTCGDGSGQGIVPRSSGWVTMTLPPGRYEAVCNLAGHYAAGMYSQLIVS